MTRKNTADASSNQPSCSGESGFLAQFGVNIRVVKNRLGRYWVLNTANTQKLHEQHEQQEDVRRLFGMCSSGSSPKSRKESSHENRG
jgi:hypothetical protein